jgi:hypothetical protein
MTRRFFFSSSSQKACISIWYLVPDSATTLERVLCFQEIQKFPMCFFSIIGQNLTQKYLCFLFVHFSYSKINRRPNRGKRKRLLNLKFGANLKFWSILPKHGLYANVFRWPHCQDLFIQFFRTNEQILHPFSLIFLCKITAQTVDYPKTYLSF